MKKFEKQSILGDAWPVADLIVEYIKLQPEVKQAAIAGSIRRGLEVVRNIDIVVESAVPDSLIPILAAMPGVEQAAGQGNNKYKLTMTNGLVCNIYLVKTFEFIPALFYYTGSTGYIERLAEQAAKRGLVLSAAGIKKRTGEPVAVKDEYELYSLLNVDYVEPELREDEADMTTIGLASKQLVAYPDIRGVFHVHTNYSDGASSLADMANAAHKRGWEYLGIADHSQTAVYAGGLKVKAVMRQRQEIEKLNADSSGLIILSGIECDILPDGSLDYPDEILASFDFVVASVHSAFRQSQADMTRRLVRAMQSRYVTMLGHPTGRILLGRKGYAVDLPEVIQAAAQSGTMIEINANPHRLDLDWRWCSIAREQGILLAINPDAHSVSEFEHLRYGLASARKAGLTATDIVNTRTYSEVIKLINRKRY